MDLSTLNTAAGANEGAKMELCHPVKGTPLRTENGEPITITLMGVDSDVYRKAVRKAQNRRLGKRNVKLTAEELEGENIETLAECTIAWDNIMLDGQVLECTKANAVRLYSTVAWVKEQADTFVEDRANFL